jgi:hypothetical protein
MTRNVDEKGGGRDEEAAEDQLIPATMTEEDRKTDCATAEVHEETIQGTAAAAGHLSFRLLCWGPAKPMKVALKSVVVEAVVDRCCDSNPEAGDLQEVEAVHVPGSKSA